MIDRWEFIEGRLQKQIMPQTQVINKKDNIYAMPQSEVQQGSVRKMSKEVQEQKNTTVAEQRGFEQRQIEGAKRQVQTTSSAALSRGPQTVEALTKNAHINSRSIQTRCCAWTDTVYYGTAHGLCWTCLRFSLNTPTTPTALRLPRRLGGWHSFRCAPTSPLANGAIWGPRDTFSGVLAPTTRMHGAR